MRFRLQISVVLIKSLAGSGRSILLYHNNLHFFALSYGISYNTTAKEDIPQKPLRKISFALRYKRRDLQNFQLFGLPYACREVFGNSQSARQEDIFFEAYCSGDLQPHKISVPIEHQLGGGHKSFGADCNPQIIWFTVVRVNSKGIQY